MVTFAWFGLTMASEWLGLLRETNKVSSPSNILSLNALSSTHTLEESFDKESVCVTASKSLPAKEKYMW